MDELADGKNSITCFSGLLSPFSLLVFIAVLFTTLGANMFKIVSWLLVLSLVPWMFLMLQIHLSIRSAHKLHGTVVSYKEGKNAKGKKMYAPNVEYLNQYGKRQTVIGGLSSSRHSKKIGDSVIVLQSVDGSKTKLLLFRELFLPYWIWLIVGIAACCCRFGQDALEWFYL